jgi:hypothetical protein
MCYYLLQQDALALDATRILQYRTGRMGTCFIAAMLYTCFLAAALLVPDWNAANKAELDARAARDIYYNGDGDDDDRVLLSSPVFVPMQWKRAHLIWASLVTQVRVQ